MRRFPLRTLLLMVLALIVFVRMWITTHKPRSKEPGEPPPQGMVIDVAPSGQAGKAPASPLPPACKPLARALEAVVRGPEDAKALEEARSAVEACPAPSVRACELGDALEARLPPAPQASPARELLGALCQRCPAEVNTCADIASRAVLEGAVGRSRTPEEVRWNLEHAGAGTQAACATLLRSALVPAAVTGGKLQSTHPALLTALAPVCAEAGHLPAAVVNAAIVNRGAQAGELSALATAAAGESSSMAPAQITGAQDGRHAFDGDEKTGVELGGAAKDRRWEADGALRAQFEPPLGQLASLRLRAKGPGTLRAIIRTPSGVGLKDDARGTAFVNPTLCEFQGTGQWEVCTLGVPLLEVEALSVFPTRPELTVYEVQVQGSR